MSIKYLSSLRKQSRLGEMRGGCIHLSYKAYLTPVFISLSPYVLFEKDQLTIQQIVEDLKPCD